MLRNIVAIGKEYYESLSLAEKRKQYKCGDKYLVLDKIEPWSKTRKAIYPSMLTHNTILMSGYHFLLRYRISEEVEALSLQPRPFPGRQGLHVARGHHATRDRRHCQCRQLLPAGRGRGRWCYTQCCWVVPAQGV